MSWLGNLFGRESTPPLTSEQKRALWMTPMELTAASTTSNAFRASSSGIERLDIAKETIEWATPIVDQLAAASRLAEAGRFDDAISGFKKVLDVAPEAPIALMSIGCCYGAKRNKAEGKKWLTRALKSEPNNARIQGNLDALRDM
jgi:Flp pilus assembly protein TadD